ncbi:MAG: energy transducer TonB [Gammaproteobacteria bacterium]|nr:energy transducer TonB [Gammaproteobacteria bacterium]
MLVSFTVDGQGNVQEDSISVVDAEPPDIFNRSSIRATERFKFQPRIRNGEGVEVTGVQYLFRYVLNNDNDDNDV